MDIATLHARYASGQETPVEVVNAIYDAIEKRGRDSVWISLVPREDTIARAKELASQDKSKLPLFGIPFAVKDNIDIAKMPTTAACPAYAYTPSESATVVSKLEAAGAILIGKTNMDQFATGLVGTRSPFGIPHSVFGQNMISGGSSSGSAVAVAAGLVSFALGTDTAGSGRVPAMFNNIIGLKPTRGLLSAHGVVPACRSLDCVSIFAGTASDAKTVLMVAQGFDPKDPYSRQSAIGAGASPWSSTQFGKAAPRIGVLRTEDRNFFGDPLNGSMYEAAISEAKASGAEIKEIDIEPFLAAAKLLYGGPWVAERFAAVGDFAEKHAAEMDKTVASIVLSAKTYSASDAFKGIYELERLRKITAATWNEIDTLMLPTAPRAYTIDEIQAEPIERNSHLGTYTNFVNLMDLAAIAVPAGIRSDGLPFGITLIAPAFSDPALLQLADSFHRAMNQTIGGTRSQLANTRPIQPDAVPHGCQLMAVVGAHLTGQPLNWQLTDRGGRLLRTCKTHPDYRFYALKGTVPPKPGLKWEPGYVGPGIEVEVWALPADTVGSFLAGVPSPLAIGTLRLEDGTQVQGFLAEPAALEDATEITHFGGWRSYLTSLQK